MLQDAMYVDYVLSLVQCSQGSPSSPEAQVSVSVPTPFPAAQTRVFTFSVQPVTFQVSGMERRPRERVLGETVCVSPDPPWRLAGLGLGRGEGTPEVRRHGNAGGLGHTRGMGCVRVKNVYIKYINEEVCLVTSFPVFWSPSRSRNRKRSRSRSRSRSPHRRRSVGSKDGGRRQSRSRSRSRDRRRRSHSRSRFHSSVEFTSAVVYIYTFRAFFYVVSSLQVSFQGQAEELPVSFPFQRPGPVPLMVW